MTEIREEKGRKKYYYTDELNDDFAGVDIKAKEISSDYKYINNNIFWRAAAFIVLRIIMQPVAYLYCKLKFGLRIVNRKILKEYKNTGYFVFGNHTQIPGDGYFPVLTNFPKKTHFIVNPDNVSTKGTEQLMLMLGCMPLPSTIDGMKNFMGAIKQRLDEKKCIMVYPEAHIWPYYTKIRDFPSTSFKLPVKYNVPSFCVTTTYHKRKHRRTPQITIYVDGPYLPKQELSARANRDYLRDSVYKTMCERARLSDTQVIDYIRVKENEVEIND